MNSKDIKDTINEVEIDQTRSDYIYRNLLEEKKNVEKGRRKNKVYNRRRIVSIAAAFIVVISSSVLAYKGINFKFLDFLNKNNIAKENYIGDLEVDEYIYNIDQEVISKEGKLYIDQAIMDKNIIYIYMNFESLNGVDFNEDKYYSFRADKYDETSRDLIEKGSSASIDDLELTLVMGNPRVIESRDNRIDMIFSYDMTDYKDDFKGFVDSELNFDFKDLGYYEEERVIADDEEEVTIITSDFVPLIEGRWMSKFKLGGKLLPSRFYDINEKLDFNTLDGEVNALNIEKVEISNLSLELSVDTRNEDQVDFITDLVFEESHKGKGDLKIKNKDGSIVDTKSRELLSYSEEEGVTIKRSFDNPINIDKIDSIILWGQEIKLK